MSACAASTIRFVKGSKSGTFDWSLTVENRASGPTPIEMTSLIFQAIWRPAAYCFRSAYCERKRPRNSSGSSHRVASPKGNQVPKERLTHSLRP